MNSDAGIRSSQNILSSYNSAAISTTEEEAQFLLNDKRDHIFRSRTTSITIPPSAEPPTTANNRKLHLYLKLLIVFAAITAIIVLFSLGLQSKLIEVLRFIQQHSSSPLGYLSFIAFFTLISLTGIPVSIPSLAAGFIFPIYFSIPLVTLSVFIAGSIGFLCGKYLLHEWIMTFEFTKKRTFTILHRAIQSEGWKISFLIRFSQVLPFAIGNYLLSCTPVHYFVFIITTVVGTFPGLAFFTYIGSLLTDLTDIDSAFGEHPKRYATMVLIVVSCVIFTLVCITCVARRAWRETVLRMTQQEAFERLEYVSDVESCVSSNDGLSPPLYGSTSTDDSQEDTNCDSPSYFTHAITFSNDLMQKFKYLSSVVIQLSPGQEVEIVDVYNVREPFGKGEKIAMFTSGILSTVLLGTGIPVIYFCF